MPPRRLGPPPPPPPPPSAVPPSRPSARLVLLQDDRFHASAQSGATRGHGGATVVLGESRAARESLSVVVSWGLQKRLRVQKDTLKRGRNRRGQACYVGGQGARWRDARPALRPWTQLPQCPVLFLKFLSCETTLCVPARTLVAR